ncbi:MAG: phosphopantetheine adenylyltransferase [Thermoproteota archaeon]|nr:MAG: phosphopantetheine adenylyltransferase [Candidatus Korarchaeota archaeon]
MTVPCFKLSAVGGTFDRFHIGHEVLLKTAFTLSETVIVGITSSEMLRNKALKERIQSFKERFENVVSYLKRSGFIDKAVFYMLRDDYGPALWIRRLEALFVSPETYPKALILNGLRAKQGLGKLVIVVIPTILAENGKPISSTRIRGGLIRRDGSTIKL